MKLHFPGIGSGTFSRPTTAKVSSKAAVAEPKFHAVGRQPTGTPIEDREPRARPTSQPWSLPEFAASFLGRQHRLSHQLFETATIAHQHAECRRSGTAR